MHQNQYKVTVRLEEIAKQVMAETNPRPQITGRGHAERVKAPRNQAVWRVLSYDEKSTGRGSRCGFTAKAIVNEVLNRASKEGIVWDWDGKIAWKLEHFEMGEKLRGENVARELAFQQAGGQAACDFWFAEHPEASGNCQAGSGQYANRIRKNFIDSLMAK